MDDTRQGTNTPLDFADLADFQFVPSWARSEGDAKFDLLKKRHVDRPERPRRSADQGAGSRPLRGRGFDGDQRRNNRDRRDGKRREVRGERQTRREMPTPVEGFRVELRPANAILELFSQKIQEQKRAFPLLDLARIVMAGKERYDLVFMKQESAPMLIHSTKGDGACWLTQEEAVAYMWHAPWFADLYKKEEVEAEAPKGSFNAVATCSLGGEVIGPVNWHGYQAALMNLYRSRYSRMQLGSFKNSISQNKDEAAVKAWLDKMSKKTVWKPLREGAGDVVLEDAKAVEADFLAHGYSEVYEVADKVFVNGNVTRNRLSPGLAAHLFLLSDRTRRAPQMLIPNLCHGLARHHMPIYKWKGNHFTGPSRVRTIPEGTVLADRMMAIINWTKEHSGEKVETMFAALSGVSAGTDEESRKLSQDAYAPYAADMLWLLEQGFIVVTSDNAVWFPKGEAAPSPVKVEQKKGRHSRSGKGKPAPAPKEPQQDTPAAPAEH